MNPSAVFELNAMPFNLPGTIYRGKMPAQTQLEAIQLYKEAHQITHIFLLQTQQEWEQHLKTDLKKLYEEKGYVVEHYPIKDGCTIEKAAMKELVGKILAVAKEGKNALVHCKGGTGRTSMVLSCVAQDALECEPDKAVKIVEEAISQGKSTPFYRGKLQNDLIRYYNKEYIPSQQARIKKAASSLSTDSSVSFPKEPQDKKLNFEMTQIPFDLGGKVFRGKMPTVDQLDHVNQLQKIHQISHIFLLQTEEEWLTALGKDLKKLYEEAGYQVEHYPIIDGYVVTKEKMKELVAKVQAVASSGKNAVIHCMGGRGRTALVMACLAIDALNLNGLQAMDFIRIFIQNPEFTTNKFQGTFILNY